VFFLLNSKAARTLPTLSTAAQTTTRSPPPLTEFRLPKIASPTLYELTLRYDFDPFDFKPEKTLLPYTGEVTISVDLSEPTSTIDLHMDRNVALSDPAIVIINVDTNDIAQVDSSDYTINQIYSIKLVNEISNGSYTIFIKFRSTTTVDGNYFHSYDDGAAKRSLIGTRFLPVQARTAL
jgi:hypothetical protein